MYARPLNSKKPETTFIFTQSSSASVWTVVHNLGHYPAAVRLVDDTNSTVVGEVFDIDVNTVRVTFTTPVQGRAFVS